MTKFACLAVVCGVLTIGASPLRADDALQAIIEKAISGHGGEANITRCKTGMTKVKGTMDTPWGEAEFSQEDIFDLPGKFRRTMGVKTARLEFKVTFVVNGEKTWSKRDDQPAQEISGPSRALDDHWLMPISRLAQLKMEGVDLSSLEEQQVFGRPSRGVKVTLNGVWHADLFFDNGSGLHVKSRKKAKDITGKESVTETLYTNHKEFDGLKLPTRITTYGSTKKPMVDMEVVDVKLLKRVDGKIFAKPE